MRRWPFTEQKLLAQRPENFIKAFALSSSGRMLAIAQGRKTTVEIMEIPSGKTLRQNEVENCDLPSTIAWSPDEKYLALANFNTMQILDAETLKPCAALTGEYLCAVCFSPDGKLLGIGDWEKGRVVEFQSLLDGTAKSGKPERKLTAKRK